MKFATRKNSRIVVLVSSCLIPLNSLTTTALAGNHPIAAGADRVSGCIDGNCGAPPTPFGHYQASWRRWPFAKDSTMEPRDQGTSPREPFVPDAINEDRIRPRTRSDKPLSPKDMIGGMADSGVGSLAPAVPDAGDEANPFNQTVEETDLPGNSSGFSDPMETPNALQPAATTETNDMFQDPAPAPAPASDEFDFNSTPDSTPDFFDQGSDLPIPPSQQTVQRTGAIRSIKNRGVQLHSGILLNNLVTVPEQQQGTGHSPNTTPAKSTHTEQLDIGLVSFEDFEIKSGASSPPVSPSKLTNVQVDEFVALPKQLDQGISRAEEPASQVPTTADAELVVEPENAAVVGPGNPLRPHAKPHVQPKRVVSKAPVTAIPEPMDAVDRDLPLVTEAKPLANALAHSRTLSSVASSRSLRETLRKNPLRR